MGYTIKQKIEICLKSDANPQMTQIDLANWAMEKYGSKTPPSQTTISRILSSKSDILGSKESDFSLVRRRKVSNPLLRYVLTEWMTQAHWERIPVTTPIIQSTANAIWNKLASKDKDGNGIFSHKWCNHFMRKLNVNLIGSPQAIEDNLGFPLNKVWKLDEKVDLKRYIRSLITKHNYSPKDLFTLDEFSLFYCVPLDQIFDVSSVDKGLSQTSNFSDFIITIMLGCNMDGSEKLNPLVVSKHETFDLSKSTISTFRSNPAYAQLSSHSLANKINEAYQITYKFNNNKWITSSTFQDYLLTLDHKLESVSPGRKILIVLDDSSTHRLMNLEFNNIRLIYLENASKHNNPFNGLYNEVKFDYIPTSFGIIEEFKIVFRLQQYLEMINKQNNQVSGDPSSCPISAQVTLSGKGNDCGEVLSENDYQVPFIKAIEWIKRSWDSINVQKIYHSWVKSNIVDTKLPWPATDPRVQAEAAQSLLPLMESLAIYDPNLAYDKLRNVMNYLNVVIPWELNELLGLVNERAKVSLNYASVDEMINSCASNEKNSDSNNEHVEESLYDPQDQVEPSYNSWNSPKVNVATNKNLEISSMSPLRHALHGTRSVGSGQMSSFQEKLPPVTMVPSARQMEFSGAMHPTSNPYSLRDNRSSSMNALLQATNATNTPNTSFPVHQASGNDKRFEDLAPMALPAGAKRPPPDLIYNNMFPEPASNSIKRRHNLENSTVFDNASQYSIVDSPSTFSESPRRKTQIGFPHSLLNSTITSPSDLQQESQLPLQDDLASVLRKVIEATNNNGLKLSDSALEELKRNLSTMQ